MKAILFNKHTFEKIEVITNVINYTESGIFGDSILKGINWNNMDFLLVDDSIDTEKTIEELKEFDVFASVDYQKKLEEIRTERNRLLAETDYIIMADYPISEEKKQEYVLYRQSLRDLIDNIDINNVVFPQKP